MHMSVFETLSDPSRRRIVEALRGGERAVNDIVIEVEIHQTGVSRHLRILHDAGFVRVRPDGPRRLYSLRPEPFRELDAWVAGYRRLWEGRLDKLGEALDRMQRARLKAQAETVHTLHPSKHANNKHANKEKKDR
jgi:DNA-binding transcriptional ArsR family regulator